MPIADLDYREYFTLEATEKLKTYFDRCDTNGDGSIGESELIAMMKKMGRSLSRSQVRELVKSVDFNNTGEIEFEEFCMLEIMMSDAKPRADLINYRDYVPDKTVKQLSGLCMQHWQQNGETEQGLVDLDATCKILETLGCKAGSAAVEAIFQQIGPEGDSGGPIDFEALCCVWAIASKLRRKCNYREFLTNQQVASFKKLFNTGTKNEKGCISFGELELILRRLGLQVKKSQMSYLMHNFDTDDSGDCDFEEFCVMMLRLKGIRRNRVINPDTCSCGKLWLEDNFNIKELQQSGFGLKHFREVHIPVGNLVKEGGISALEFRRAGYTPMELRRGGLGAEELRRCGFSLGDLRNAGFSDGVLRTANKTLQSSFTAGDLSPLPQQRPASRGRCGPFRGATPLLNAGSAQMAPPRQTWQLPPRPMTQMIREHTDWKAPVTRNRGSVLSFCRSSSGLAEAPGVL